MSLAVVNDEVERVIVGQDSQIGQVDVRAEPIRQILEANSEPVVFHEDSRDNAVGADFAIRQVEPDDGSTNFQILYSQCARMVEVLLARWSLQYPIEDRIRARSLQSSSELSYEVARPVGHWRGKQHEVGG